MNKYKKINMKIKKTSKDIYRETVNLAKEVNLHNYSIAGNIALSIYTNMAYINCCIINACESIELLDNRAFEYIVDDTISAERLKKRISKNKYMAYTFVSCYLDCINQLHNDNKYDEIKSSIKKANFLNKQYNVEGLTTFGYEQICDSIVTKENKKDIKRLVSYFYDNHIRPYVDEDSIRKNDLYRISKSL